MGHFLTEVNVAKGAEADGIIIMPSCIALITFFFFRQVQFYSKFLPDLSPKYEEPLYQLAKKDVQWQWVLQQTKQ